MKNAWKDVDGMSKKNAMRELGIGRKASLGSTSICDKTCSCQLCSTKHFRSSDMHKSCAAFKIKYHASEADACDEIACNVACDIASFEWREKADEEKADEEKADEEKADAEKANEEKVV